MTPPVTPPNESYQNIYVGSGPEADPGKPPTGKGSGSKVGITGNGVALAGLLYCCWERKTKYYHPDYVFDETSGKLC